LTHIAAPGTRLPDKFVRLVQGAGRALPEIPASLPLLALRFALAVPFFKSGLTKWDGFQLSAGTRYQLALRGAAEIPRRTGANPHGLSGGDWRDRHSGPARHWIRDAGSRPRSTRHDRHHSTYDPGRLGKFSPPLGCDGVCSCGFRRRQPERRPVSGSTIILAGTDKHLVLRNKIIVMQ
jgi:hypothetical protein